jgi:hypothetical protein
MWLAEHFMLPKLLTLFVCLTLLVYSIVDFFFSVLGFELRAYTLILSTSPVFVMGFFKIFDWGWL